MFTTEQALHYSRELSDGYSIYCSRLHVWPNNAGSVSYIPLEPNPLGHKARLTITDNEEGTIEITNFKSRAWALWNFADYMLDADELLTEAADLMRMEDAN